MAVALNNFGIVKMDMGEPEAAAQLFQEALALRRAAGDQFGVMSTLANLANLASEREDFAQALALQEEVLAHARQAGDPQAIAQSLINIASVMSELGRSEGLVALLDEARTLGLEVGDQEVLAAERLNRGGFLAAQGDRLAGARMMADSVPMWLQQENLHGLHNALTGLMDIACDTGQGERAARLLGALGVRLSESSSERRNTWAQLETMAQRIQEHIDPVTFEQARAIGRAFTETQLIAEANQAAGEELPRPPTHLGRRLTHP